LISKRECHLMKHSPSVLLVHDALAVRSSLDLGPWANGSINSKGILSYKILAGLFHPKSAF